MTTAGAARDLIDRTGARGLAGDLFVDGAGGSRTARLHQPYTDAPHLPPGWTGNSYLDADAITAHLHACTEAGITAGFHVIGDAAVSAVMTALERLVDHFGQRWGRPAAVIVLEHLEMVTEDQAARLGSWGAFASVQPNFDAAWGGEDGMYVQRLGSDRGRWVNPFRRQHLGTCQSRSARTAR